MNIQMLPLNRLIPSPANVRKTGTHIGIEELAASIAAHGLLQNLQVRASAKGKFEVVAGGRRLAALKHLVKQNALEKDAAIGCHVLDTEDAGEISLAENTVRVAMHPADQFAAFQALAATGKGPEEIAARFGVTAAVVRQRLKLAAVSPALIELYRAEEMSLDQLMAFTVSDDHAAQEAAWSGQPEWQRSASAIRRTLTAAHIEADDPRVQFVGIDAYQAAGGTILRDLFEEEHEGYLTDPILLDRLVTERLEVEASALRTEGWKWVDAVAHLDHDALRLYGHVQPVASPLSPEQQAERDSLSAEYDALVEGLDEEADTEADARLDSISARLDVINEAAFNWQADDLARAGAIVTVGYDGALAIRRGLVRPEDKASTPKHRDGNSEAEGENTVSPLSAKLVEDLTAERTAALRATLCDNEAVALVAVAHALALPIFYPHASSAESCLDLRIRNRDLRSSAEGIDERGASVLLRTREDAWLKRLPEDPTALFGWLLGQDIAAVTALITLCTALSIDAVQGKQDEGDCPRLVHSGELAGALGLDMAAWWEPTRERYLGRVSKALILEAVGEGVSPSAANNLAAIKTKSELIDRAAERLAGTGWLPVVLRPAAEIPEVAEPLAEAAE